MRNAKILNPISIEYETSEEKDDETKSAKCISINDVRVGGDSGSGIGDNSEPRILTDEDIVIRAQARIAAAFPTTYDSLMMCLSRNISHSPTQRRYTNQEAASVFQRQHQKLLAITEGLGLLKGDEKAFVFMKELSSIK